MILFCFPSPLSHSHVVISFPGKEIMPHPFLPLLWQLPSSHHSHGGAQGGQGRAATTLEQLGPEAGQGALSKEEMFLYWE